MRFWNPRIFSTLPVISINIMEGKLKKFKNALDEYLHVVADQSGCQGHVGLRAATSNDKTDQRSKETQLHSTSSRGDRDKPPTSS